MEYNKLIQEFISQCNLLEDDNGRFFSTTMDKYTEFKNKYNIDFHELWDNIEPEEKLKYLYR